MPSVLVDGERVANGTWGSIWLLPGEGSGQSNAVEVDLVEGGYLLQGVDPLRVIASNVHATPPQVVVDAGVDLSAGYHTYGAELDTATGHVAFYLDGRQYASFTGGPRSAVFLLLNAHVANANAAHWHSQVVDGTQSADMAVAEVRVFERPPETHH
jgi:beta-glucanase (GH16 family)